MQSQRQTLLFSATMPKKIQNFAKSALVKPGVYIHVHVHSMCVLYMYMFKGVDLHLGELPTC